MSEEAVQATVWGVAACALVAAVAGLEGRVVFFAFQRFILVPQPWSWILVSVALYGAHRGQHSHSPNKQQPQVGSCCIRAVERTPRSSAVWVAGSSRVLANRLAAPLDGGMQATSAFAILICVFEHLVGI